MPARPSPPRPAKINYYGVSYGTYLGSVYAQIFPQRTDRIVLDSAVDPQRYGIAMIRDMAAPNEAALDAYYRDGTLPATDTTCHTG